MKKYHLRRREKSMEEKEILSIINDHNHLTLALCKDNEPYLVTMNYGFDERSKCFYFHCATKGKKLDFLNSNTLIWGQILDDIGYIKSECNYNFRTVQFKGKASFIEDIDGKREALNLMIDRLEEEPEMVKKKMLYRNNLKGVTIIKIDILEMTGKKYIEKNS